MVVITDTGSRFMQLMGIEIIEASPQRTVGRMPVDGRTQPFGLLAGGASCALAESVASFAANLHTAPDRAVGIELNASHHSSARGGWVTATATALHLGRRIVSYEVVITDERERRVCTARITCAVVPVQ